MDKEQLKAKILEKLRELRDPEIGYDVVSLGLVYNIDIDEKNKKLSISLGLTTPFCPLAGFILADAYRLMSEIEEFSKEQWDINIFFDFNTIWTPDRMNPELQERFSIYQKPPENELEKQNPDEVSK